jgi:hypothetical protein
LAAEREILIEEPELWNRFGAVRQESDEQIGIRFPQHIPHPDHGRGVDDALQGRHMPHDIGAPVFSHDKDMYGLFERPERVFHGLAKGGLATQAPHLFLMFRVLSEREPGIELSGGVEDAAASPPVATGRV